jgi:predicted RNA methylase
MDSETDGACTQLAAAPRSNPVFLLGREWSMYFPANAARPPYEPARRLQITRTGKYMLTRPLDAEMMSRHIIQFCRQRLGIADPSQLRVTDATAGCGGNALNCLQHFAHVTAVENDPVHFGILKNNLAVYGYGDGPRLELINADYTTVLARVSEDVVILDCPWMDPDAPWYSRAKSLSLFLSCKPVAAVVDELFRLASTKVVVVKAPRNFDMQAFVKQVSKARDVTIKICKIHSYMALIIAPEPPLFL